MTTAQKIIKKLAIAFAIVLIISIISAIVGTFYGLSFIFGLKDDNQIVNEEMKTTTFENTDVTALYIDVAYTNLTIKTADMFRLETNNDNINYEEDNNNIFIKEKNYNWFSKHYNKELIIYIPEHMSFEKVDINQGAGKIDVENLDTETLLLELGAGKTSITKLNVSKNCNINGGAGKLDILDGTINELDLDMGVGEVNINAILQENTKIDAGVGNLNIKLQGNQEDYRIKADKGIGTIKIDGIEISNGQINGKGRNYIEIDGGIGNIDINF